MIISRSLCVLVSSFGKFEIIVQTPQDEQEDLRDNSHQVLVSSKCQKQTNKKPLIHAIISFRNNKAIQPTL